MSFTYWKSMAAAEGAEPDFIKSEEPENVVNSEIINVEDTTVEGTAAEGMTLKGTSVDGTTVEDTTVEDITEEDITVEDIVETSASTEPVYAGSKAGYICRIIFLDIPFGIPFALIVLVLISAFVAAFTAVGLSLALAFLGGLAGALVMTAHGVIYLPVRLPMGLSLIGSGLIIAAVSILCLVLAILLWFRLVPKIAGCYGAFCDRLGLFRRRVKQINQV